MTSKIRQAAELLIEASDIADSIVGPSSSSRQGRSTAALLMAVQKDIEAWNGYMPDQATNAKIHKCAAKLAKEILGESNG